MLRPLIISVALMLGLVASLTAATPSWPDTVRFGVIPVEGGATISDRFEPLVSHLEAKLGLEVELFTATDYAGIITAMANKHIEMAYFGPKSYTEAADRAGAQAVAMENDVNGNPGYYGVIITRADSGITTLAQAKGKVFSFTDPNSTSGYLVPNVLFYRDLNVKPDEYFSQVKFSGSHNASILAVKNGDIEVAATNNIDIDRAVETGQIKGDEFNTVWTSELIPGSPYCVRSDLPESLKVAIAGSLFAFNSNKEGLEKLQISRFTYTNDSVYDVIRYLKRLKSQLAKAQ